MTLYIVQHGQALSKEEDPERPLTEKGIKDAKKCADFLKQAGVSPEIILHSEKARAIETALIFAEVLHIANIGEKKDMAPNDSIKSVLSCIENTEKDMMIVGHLPFLQKLTSYLLTGHKTEDIIDFKMAGCIALEKQENKKWGIRFFIIPDTLK